MNAMQQAAQERLDAVLAAPARGRTRHDQVAELCQQHAKDQHVVTKEVAVAETTATGPDITGEFTAIVSDFGPDRQHERFTIGSFDKALDKIRRTGKATPVLFGHTQNAIGAVLGMVPPDGWRTDHDGLHAHGWLDVTEPLGMRMYKMLQSGALQWSIGFTTTRRAPRGRDGIVPLEEVGELLEVSVVPVPANERTRTLSAKSDRQPMSVEQLRQLEAEVGSPVHSTGSRNIARASRASTSFTPSRTASTLTGSSKRSPGSEAAEAATSTTPSPACATQPAPR